MTVSQLVAFLNAISCGEIGSIVAKLDEARAACAALGHESLAEQLAEARGALASGDMKTYRRKVETVVSRLGHLRD